MLETKEILVNVEGLGKKRIYATFSQFTADALAMNQMFVGLIESFSGDYCCPICYASKLDMGSYFYETSFEKRTPEYHKRDLDLIDVENKKRENGEKAAIHINGVKTNTLLNEANFFHFTTNCTIDVMHTGPEGNIPYEVGAVLYDFIKIRKLFSWDDLNNRVRWLFLGLEVDKGSTPCEFNSMKAQHKGLSPNPTAVEMLTLLNYLPLLIGHFVSEGDSHWKFLLEIHDIAHLMFAPRLTDSLLTTFTELYARHLKLFSQIFPHLYISRPKQHFLVHFNKQSASQRGRTRGFRRIRLFLFSYKIIKFDKHLVRQFNSSRLRQFATLYSL